jgi:hypothetical protein
VVADYILLNWSVILQAGETLQAFFKKVAIIPPNFRISLAQGRWDEPTDKKSDHATTTATTDAQVFATQ